MCLGHDSDGDKFALQIQLIIENMRDNMSLMECKPNGKFLH
jgi:hypothetical protein